ncbi:MAG TPA: SDR family NAD(P)-dependent oxidoreductase [Solirubrobacteraceae bacterium]|nr:SDR family NAD(P)-dependent oxidoreductase [Solirubrobacteraceae bacterium]
MSKPAPGADGRRVLVAGGTSEIALAILGALQARAEREVALLGRDREALERAGERLREQGVARALTVPIEAAELSTHGAAVRQASEQLGGADLAILAVGALEPAGGATDDVEAALRVLQVNLLGAGSLLMHLADALRASGGGTLVVLSSVAAERPRRANPVYGASKAGLDALAQGMGDVLRDHGVHVLVVRPGFVRTRMTEGLDPAPFATSAEAVAAVVVRGLARDAHTVWAPPALRWVMLAVRLLPRSLLRRVKR